MPVAFWKRRRKFGIAGIDSSDVTKVVFTHKPGHISLKLAGGDGMIISADAATNRIVSFEHPGWKFGFDTLAEVAIRKRQKLMDRAATDRIKLLGYHWTYPGIGYAERKGPGYRFVAA
jgi:glyoxylase-like metal-dependent hydrolase (beta-lactamase superfamily II)